MALKADSSLAKVAALSAATLAGLAVGGVFGGATIAIVGRLVGEALSEPGKKLLETLSEKIGEYGVDEAARPLVDDFQKAHPTLEEVYREAFRLSLLWIFRDAGGQEEPGAQLSSVPASRAILSDDEKSWFLNWDAALRTDIAIDSQMLLLPEDETESDACFKTMMERVDAQGTMIRTKGLSIRLTIRDLPVGLETLLRNKVSTHFSEFFNELLVKPENISAMNMSELLFQQHILKSFAELKQTVDATHQSVLRAGESLERIEHLVTQIPTAGLTDAEAYSQFLISPSDKSDAWQLFAPPVEIVGRKDELDRLDEFFGNPSNFAWQVLFGVNAVGKSRLAQEWLLHRMKLNPDCVCGFVPEPFSNFEGLLSLRPTKEIILVIDNANEIAEKALEFIDRARQAWAAKDSCKTRILVLAHSDLNTSASTFEQDARLRESREGQITPAQKHRKQDGTRIRGSKKGRDPRPGIRLQPLKGESDQTELIRRSAELADVELTQKDVQEIIRFTDGLPALLALAGCRPDDWQSCLPDYAQGVVKRTKREFADCEEDGLSILVLSAIAGPIDASVANHIAPRAWEPARLAALFSVDESTVAETIPAFEPDFLGQEVAICALLALRPDLRQKLCDQICSAAPGRALEKITAAWKRKSEDRRLAQAWNHSAHAGRAALDLLALENLFHAVSKVVPRGLNFSFFGLYASRATCLVDALCDAPTDSACVALVQAFFPEQPEDSLMLYLQRIHAEIPCNVSSRLQWAALLQFYATPVGSPWPEKLGPLSFLKGPQNDIQSSVIVTRLRSTYPLERVIAAFQIAEILRDRLDPEHFFTNSDVIKSELLTMVSSRRTSDRISSAFALSWFMHDNDDSPGLRHLGQDAVRSIYNAFSDRRRSQGALLPLSYALAYALRSPYSVAEVESWLPVEVGMQDSGRQSWISPSVELSTSVVSTAQSYLRESDLDTEVAFNLARTALRLGQLLPEATLLLSRSFNDEIISRKEKSEVLIRSIRMNGEDKLSILRAAARSRERDLRFLAIVALMHLELLEELRALGDISVDLPEKLSTADLLDAVEDKAKSGYWSGWAVAVLRQGLADMTIAQSGRLIHELKARDTTGRWAYYFVLVQPPQEQQFLAAIEGDGTIDLLDYGKIIASSYGEKPSDEMREMLKSRYNFDV